MLISIVITVRNEEKSIAKLIDSLIVQEKPFEIIVVDAESTDGTRDIVKKYAEKYENIRLFIHPGSRGEGRNYGVKQASGEFIAFTDGGCWAEKNWLKELRSKIKEGFDVVAGKTINEGPFKDVERVGIYYKGVDVTYPSCNLAYKKNLFNEIRGFDVRFVTAEDIDLNLRAVNAGAKFAYNENAIIHRRTAQNLISFMRQSFWYGYGRKQLALKYGKLWKSYSLQETIKMQFTIFGILRLIFGFLGYAWCGLKERGKWREGL